MKPSNIAPLEFLCDRRRHLVCRPYSVANLHRMAAVLQLKRCWFHRDHYDIPQTRIAEITARCRVVTSREIVSLIRHSMSHTALTLKFITETPHARLFQNSKGAQLWIPKSICKSCFKLPASAGDPDVRTVEVADWWLNKNPWPTGQQSLL